MLTVHQGETSDASAAIAVMFEQPSREVVALLGGHPARARALLEAQLRRAMGHETTLLLAREDDELVGFAQLGPDHETTPAAAAAWMAARALGPIGLLRAASRSRARARVALPGPPGALHLVELQVRPARRGRGVGGALLDEVEARGRRDGHRHLSLTTTTRNPAQRLYERHGFELVDRREDAGYERLTGAAGRVLMVKTLV